MRADFIRTDLSSSVRCLHGVGEKRAEALIRLGIPTIRDLLFFFPRRYEDRRHLTPFDELYAGGFVCAVAEVLSLSASEGSAPTSAFLTDGRGEIKAVWFNPHVSRVLTPGTRVALYGRVEYYNGLQLANPEFEVLWEGQDSQIIGHILPIYPATMDLPQKRLRKLIDDAIKEYSPQLADFLPEKIREKYGMKGLREAILELHHPKNGDAWIRARNRLAFDELFLLQTGLLLRRRAEAHSLKPSLALRPGRYFELFKNSLPFPMTRAQKRAIDEIFQDMRGGAAMNRLLQGDVGSGKTLVAVAALLAAADSGAQAAFMAPTEILAQQHYMRMKAMLEPLGVNVGLLTGSLRARERRSVLESLASGEAEGGIQILVGTHALFSEEVSFANLGLVIVDEQHRFGVLQRNALLSKGDAPHVLVMTATPIPRTLTLSVYGDLDVSVLDELPPGRKPVTTVSMRQEDPALAELIRERVRLGQQVYWVCPLIEEGEMPLSSVSSRVERLSTLFPDMSVEALHGRLSMEEKSKIMQRFADRELDLLVATVVIEVGMDVSNATVMVIEDAGQFGLAQLHQLRGRVGRGEAASVCVLLEGDGTTPEGHERIEAMINTSDGFALADADLKQRGPGEVCGVRQHGVTDFKVANLVRDRKILELARKEAQALLERDPALRTEPRLRVELIRKLGKTLHLAGTA